MVLNTKYYLNVSIEIVRKIPDKSICPAKKTLISIWKIIDGNFCQENLDKTKFSTSSAKPMRL